MNIDRSRSRSVAGARAKRPAVVVLLSVCTALAACAQPEAARTRDDVPYKTMEPVKPPAGESQPVLYGALGYKPANGESLVARGPIKERLAERLRDRGYVVVREFEDSCLAVFAPKAAPGTHAGVQELVFGNHESPKQAERLGLQACTRKFPKGCQQVMQPTECTGFKYVR